VKTEKTLEKTKEAKTSKGWRTRRKEDTNGRNQK
jgi:hypothetical protein